MSEKTITQENSLKAIIFDMDGILIDSEPAWEAAKFEVMQRLCQIQITQADADATIGMRVEDIARHWCKQFALSETKLTEISDAINQAVSIGLVATVNRCPAYMGHCNGCKIAA